MGIGLAVGLAFGSASPGHAQPPNEAPPIPDLGLITTWYNELRPEEFFIPNAPGVWFLTPTGINCGIWAWGSFGCAGAIPGTPPGDNHIAWFNGNRSVHHGWTAAIQFPPGQALRPLPPRSYVTYQTPGAGSTTCAVTPEGNTYCDHGEFMFYMTPAGTWFKAWDDRRSYVCNSYGTCPA
jgi:hypothetical protein